MHHEQVHLLAPHSLAISLSHSLILPLSPTLSQSHSLTQDVERVHHPECCVDPHYSAGPGEEVNGWVSIGSVDRGWAIEV